MLLKRRRNFLGALFSLALLFATPLAVTWPAITRGDLPLNLEALTLRAPWQEARIPAMDVQNTTGADELVERYYPWYAFINRTGNKGEMPLWYPYEGFGAPFLALWRTRALSPFSLPLYFLPIGFAIGISIFFKLAVAGLTAYFTARRFQFTPPFALLVAIPFQMSGIFLAAHWHPISDVAPFFPLLLPCLQRLLLGDRLVWPYIALLVGIMTLGGDPETLLALFAFMVLLVFVFGIRTYQRDRIRGAVLWLVFSAALGLLLAAVQLAPYAEFLRHGRLEDKAGTFFEIHHLSTLLAPTILHNGAFAPSLSSLWLPTGMVGFLLFPLWLALRPFAHRIRKRRIEAFLMTSILAMALASIICQWLREVPLLSLMDASHFMIPLPLAMGLLAATAIDEWVHLNAEKCKLVLRKLFWLLPLWWIAGLAGTALLLAFDPSSPSMLPRFMPVLVCGVSLLLLLGITLLMPRANFGAVSLALITALLLWYVYQPHARITPASRITPETAFIRALCRDDCRVAGSDRLKKWPLAPHGIAQVFSPSGIALNRDHQFLSQTLSNPELLRLTASSQLLLTKQDIQERFASLRPILNIQEVFPSGAILLKDLQAHPRSRIVYTARTVDVAQPPLPLRAAGPPLIEGGTLPATGRDTSVTPATIRRADSNTIEIIADSRHPGVLILADAWYPGWHAAVDTVPTAIFPVDIAFRGIEISDGTHVVTFTYRPESLQLGLYLSLAGFLIVLFGLRGLYRNRHAAKVA